MELLHKYTSENLQININQLVYKIGSYHYNWHAEIELLLLLKGEIELNVDGTITRLMAGDFSIINSNSGHATFATAANSVALRIYFEPGFFLQQGIDIAKGAFQINSSMSQPTLSKSQIPQLLAKIQLAQDQPYSAFKVNALYFSLAAQLLTFFSEQPSEARGNSGKKNLQMDEAVAYIEKNFNREITLENLAKACNYSSTYLSRLFKAELGINFYEYLTRYRLQFALRELAESRKNISEIALASGFNDIKAFNQMFKKHFGRTPSDYRGQLNPDVLETDRSFKADLSDEEKAELVQILIGYTQNNGELIDPCLVCRREDYYEKYQALRTELQKIVECFPK